MINIPTHKIFPTIIIFLNVGASLFFLRKGISEWRMALYWAAAAALNYSITW